MPAEKVGKVEDDLPGSRECMPLITLTLSALLVLWLLWCRHWWFARLIWFEWVVFLLEHVVQKKINIEKRSGKRKIEQWFVLIQHAAIGESILFHLWSVWHLRQNSSLRTYEWGSVTRPFLHSCKIQHCTKGEDTISWDSN